jgi:hypothetical protein
MCRSAESRRNPLLKGMLKAFAITGRWFMYDSELRLVEHLVDNLENSNSPWGCVKHSREFNYCRGRTDVVALTSCGQVIAFEAKLTRWRVALHQAHRNLCFAHASFVVLPKGIAVIASRYSAEFQRRNVGLCYVDGDAVVVVLNPSSEDPLQPWLANLAAVAANKEPRDAIHS